MRWWSWVKRHRPQLRALVDILVHLNFLFQLFRQLFTHFTHGIRTHFTWTMTGYPSTL